MYNSKRFSPSSTTMMSTGGRSNINSTAAAFDGIRTKLLQRYGDGALKSVGQLLRSMDADGRGTLGAEELRTGLREGLGVCIADDDFENISTALNVAPMANGSSGVEVDVKLFINGIRGSVSARRMNVIQQAYRRIDSDGLGYVSLPQLMSSYDVSRHPSVLARRATAEETVAKFSKHFSDATHPDGLVTEEEFVNFYVGVSESVPQDEQFELLLIRSWALDRANTASLAAAAGRSRTGQDGVSSRYNANHGVPPPPKDPSASLGSSRSTVGVVAEDGTIARRHHPLFQTSMMEYGRASEEHVHDPQHHRPGGFTKNAPPFSAGSTLNTATTRSRV